jgi:hypothetical protein
MKENLLFTSIFFSCTLSQGGCIFHFMTPFFTDSGEQFIVGSETLPNDLGNDSLPTQPNSTWCTLEIPSTGAIDMSLTVSQDIDFIVGVFFKSCNSTSKLRTHRSIRYSSNLLTSSCKS